jgi:hypothetical protein
MSAKTDSNWSDKKNQTRARIAYPAVANRMNRSREVFVIGFSTLQIVEVGVSKAQIWEDQQPCDRGELAQLKPCK